jgi:hypothetical protein
VTSISLNNIFSSSYKNYRIVGYGMSGTVLSTNINIRFRTDGTDNTAASYSSAAFQYNLSTAGGMGASGATSTRIGNLNTNPVTTFSINIHNPFEAIRTVGIWQFTGYNTDIQFTAGAVNHNSTTIFDGFTLIPAVGNMSGNIQVFGYNN